LLARDLLAIGSVTVERRFQGWALLDDDVMFGFVDHHGTAYLRASAAIAEYFHELGSSKHPEMPYWSIPESIATDIDRLRHYAYEASDNAHIAISFGISDGQTRTVKPSSLIRPITFLALAA